MTSNPFHYALNQVQAPPGKTLWLYGEPGIAQGDVYHPWKDQADVLARKGCRVVSDVDEIGREYDAVFVHCPKQQQQAEGLIALALDRSRGFVMAAARGDAGGNRLAGMMEAYGLQIEQLSKSRAKVVWTFAADKASGPLVKQNLEHLAMRRATIEEEQWWSVPGLFGWDKIDPGSRLLLGHLPSDLSGRIADFGCGYGYLSIMALRNYSAVSSIDAYDADARAVSCCARNGGDKVHAIWQDIRALAPQPHYDAVLMNPPFHSGKAEDTALGQMFIKKAWDSLKSGGRLFMVANRQLPYEKIVPHLRILFEGEGYKVITGRAL